MAHDEGVLVNINSNAYSFFDLGNLKIAIGQARRGWLEAKDVLNCRRLRDIRPLFARTMGR